MTKFNANSIKLKDSTKEIKLNIEVKDSKVVKIKEMLYKLKNNKNNDIKSIKLLEKLF